MLNTAEIPNSANSAQSANAASPRRLGELLIAERLIKQQLRMVLAKYHRTYRLGDILVESRVISEEQLQTALQHQQKTGMRLGQALIELRSLTEEELKRALCHQLGVQFVNLDSLALDRTLKRWINPAYAQRYWVIPVAKSDDILTVALEDPSSVEAIRDLHVSTGCKIALVTSTRAAFLRAFALIYDRVLETEPRPIPRQESSHEEVAQPADERPALADPAHAREPVELRAAYEALVGQREADTLLMRDLEALNESNKRLLEELRAAHAETQRVHEASVKVLSELREQHDALSRIHLAAVAEIEDIVRCLRSSWQRQDQ